MVFGAATLSWPGSFHRLERRSAQTQSASAGVQHTILDFALGRGATPGLAHSGPHGENRAARLATAVCAPAVLAGDVHRSGALPGHLLSRGQLAEPRKHHGARTECASHTAPPAGERVVRAAVDAALSPVVERMRARDE